MRIDGKAYRSVWRAPEERKVYIFDQTRLPHEFEVVELDSAATVAEAIRSMRTRGAPLIGAVGAYGLALALHADPSDDSLAAAHAMLDATRPTAINLRWALDRVRESVQRLPHSVRADSAFVVADSICDEDVEINRAIGLHGLDLIREAMSRRSGGRVNILTHCNAGWLATVDWGTATAPIYMAHDLGIDVHVWVDETRPRNQGASLTAWELGQEGVPHTVVADNAGGHLMQHGWVDLVIVGCDRVTARGDVCNKIGTYLKALAARDNGVPFHVAMPLSTLDSSLHDGVTEVPIEERSPREVTHVAGRAEDGRVVEVQLVPDGARAANPAFDVTPARLVTSLITERGIVAANEQALGGLIER